MNAMKYAIFLLYNHNIFTEQDTIFFHYCEEDMLLFFRPYDGAILSYYLKYNIHHCRSFLSSHKKPPSKCQNIKPFISEPSIYIPFYNRMPSIHNNLRAAKTFNPIISYKLTATIFKYHY